MCLAARQEGAHAECNVWLADALNLVLLQEMNPRTPSFQRVLGNPFAYAAFKSTEPWLLEYMALDLPQLAKDVGFASASEVESTPSHKTFLACKR